VPPPRSTPAWHRSAIAFTPSGVKEPQSTLTISRSASTKSSYRCSANSRSARTSLIARSIGARELGLRTAPDRAVLVRGVLGHADGDERQTLAVERCQSSDRLVVRRTTEICDEVSGVQARVPRATVGRRPDGGIQVAGVRRRGARGDDGVALPRETEHRLDAVTDHPLPLELDLVP